MPLCTVPHSNSRVQQQDTMTRSEKRIEIEEVKTRPTTAIQSKFHTEGQLEDRVRPGPRVMVIDDDPLVLHAVKSMLTHLNCKVITAMSGMQALEIISATNKPGNLEYIELAIIDANMPVMNGYETATRLSAKIKLAELIPLHLVCLSAQDSASHIELCKKSGMEIVSKIIC